MGKKFLGLFSVSKKPLTSFLVLVMSLEIMGVALLQTLLINVQTAYAALVTIEGSPNTTATSHTLAGSGTVFIDDQIGYKFYRASSGACVYRKTTNGGGSWGGPVTVDSQTDCIGISVWYDRWTPGDSGNYIHIATMDTGDDELFYNRLDTTNDTLLLGTSVSATLGSSAVYAVATNRHSITKATDGKVYLVADDGNSTEIVSCGSACDLSASWSDVGTPPQGNADSWSMLMPLASGNIILINRSTGNALRSSVWNGSTWSSFSTIDASAIRNTTYDVGMAATLDTDTGDIYLVYAADNDNFTTADHDIRTALYSGGSWLNKTAVLTNVAGRGVLQVAISRNQNNGDIYVGYTIRSTIGTASTASTRYVYSTDGMTSWGSEQGPVNSVSGDFYGIDMNIMSYERIYISWFDNITAVRDIDGDTVADIGPDAILKTIGSQISTIRSGTNDIYIGGAFSLETIATRTVSTVVVSEKGTIDAENNLANLKLFYEIDNSDPYNCSSESYNGIESQFGSTISGGFSGVNGVASFTNSPLTITPTDSMCFYLVFDVLSTASDGDTIEISVNNPKNDVLVSGGIDVFPFEEVAISDTTTIISPNLIQNAYHFRNDDSNETGATSATGGVENTPITSLQVAEPIRIRFGVDNQGSTSTLSSTYRLEYGTSTPTCEDISSWQIVNDTEAIFLMSDSTHLTNGENTTNIITANGGVSNIGSSFIASNGGVRDTTYDTGALIIGVDEFTEFEFSVVATSTAVEGQSYCFRVTQNGTSFDTYSNYPVVTISADVTVQSFGTLVATAEVGETNVYSGGGFSIVENSSARDVTGITISETGTVNGAAGISNLELYYEFDTTIPYDCGSETYNGTETQYGTTSVNGFSEVGERMTFNDVVSISTTSTMCLYVVYDITNSAQNGQTIDINISSPDIDVTVSGGASIGPSEVIDIDGVTNIEGAILTQTHYHWRNDDGNETGATSATGGNEDTKLLDFSKDSNIRLRLGIANSGTLASVPTKFRLEYAPQITTCDIATVWTALDVSSDGWEVYDSTHLTNGANTTNINEADGGVTDVGSSFLASNGGVRDTESETGTTTLAVNEYLDVEFSIKSNEFTAYDTTYCFRVTANGVPFPVYNNYAELTTSPKRDFYIQRGSVQVSGTSATLLAGTHYDAPASNTRAFVMITNSNNTGAGHDSGGGAQNSDDVTAYIQDSNDLSTSFTIGRPPAAINTTRVDYEIIEFIGAPDTDNEIVIRNIDTLQFSNSVVVATGTTLSNVNDDSKVVVFITGSNNRNASRNFYASQITSEWDSVAQAPVFRRGDTGASIVDISYAVVEFVGINWNIQRSEHAYTAAGVIETESITAVNNLSRTFLHVQKRMGATTNVVHYGHEVWLSSIGAVSFRLESGASVAVEQTSVAWIIENTQTGIGQMNVMRSDGSTSGGTAPLALSINLITPMSATNNTSITTNTRAAGANTTYPRPMAGFTITSTSTYQIWRSNTGSAMTYRVEIVEWPVADLSLRQNYYRLYVDNDNLTPTDPWPPGVNNLGENTSITAADEPLGRGDKIRIRMTVQVANANLPAGFQNFKLQYGLRISTCSAIAGGNWFDVGGFGSSTVWRGYSSVNTSDGASLSGNPPTGGDLLISVSDRAGSLVQQNPSVANPYFVIEGENVEYDWYLEQNGANSKSTYCFRMIRGDDSTLDSYNNYPQIRTASYTPVLKKWRWYDGVTEETPTTPLANENVSPNNVINDQAMLTLRVNVVDIRNVQGDNIKFKLQFSEDVTFNNALDVSATSTCTDHSFWCYVDEGYVSDNNLITTAVLSDSDVCVGGSGDGCGRHNTAPDSPSSHIHLASTTQEYSFTIKSVASRVNAVYYFRLVEVSESVPVQHIGGGSYPSLVIEGANLILSVAGLPSGTSTAGVVTNIETTSDSINFGPLIFNNEYIGAHRIGVNTNATEGYQVLKFADQQLLNSYGIPIPSILSTNATPTSWSLGCLASSTGCLGYHSTDATLREGSTRFGPIDTYAGLETSPVEVMYSSVPTNEYHDIIYRIRVSEMQSAGDYQTNIVYLAVPSF